MYAYVIVEFFYNGKLLSQQYYNEHIEIQHLYPSHYDFLHVLYLPLIQKAQDTNSIQHLVLSENKIMINGVEHTL